MKKNNKNLGELQIISSGILTGVVTKTSVAPLERILLLYQTQGMLRANPTAPAKYDSLLGAFRTILKEESFRGLFCGNGINALRGAFVYTLKFGTNDILKKWSTKPDGTLPFLNIVLSASAAGMSQKLITYPLDIVSLRIAMGINTSTIGNGQYKGILDCINRIYTTEGLRGFYKGLGLTLGSGVPYVVIQLVMYEYMQRVTRLISDSWFLDHSRWNVLLTSSSAGAITSVLSKSLVFPFDTVRKRLMCNGMDGREKIYKNSYDCFMKIVRNESFYALYYGIKPTLIKAVIAGAVQFGSYEVIKNFFVTFNENQKAKI